MATEQNIATVPAGTSPRRRATRREKTRVAVFVAASVVIGLVGGLVAFELFELMATGDVVCLEELEHHGVTNAMLVLFGLLTLIVWSCFGAVAAYAYSETAGWQTAFIASGSLLVIEGFLVFLMFQLVLWCPA